MDLNSLLITVIFSLLSVAIALLGAHRYYRKLIIRAPDWAEGLVTLIKTYPKVRPSNQDLLKQFQKALGIRELDSPPSMNSIVCNSCGSSSITIDNNYLGDNGETSLVSFVCPDCGWNKVVDF